MDWPFLNEDCETVKNIFRTQTDHTIDQGMKKQELHQYQTPITPPHQITSTSGG